MADSRYVRILTGEDVRRALDVGAAIVAQREAFRQLTAGEAHIPTRTVMSVPGGTTLFMPGFLQESGAFGLKIVSVIPSNPERGLATVLGAIVLLDPNTGEPIALMDATYLTALRTATGSALATDVLASATASVLTVFGAGPQAREHIRAIRSIRPIREVRIVSRTRAKAESLAASVVGIDVEIYEDRSRAVRGSDVVVTATNSHTPVFDGRDLDAGTHINAVGAYTPQTREVDEHVVQRARLVVDTREGAMEEAGDLLIPMDEGLIPRDAIDAELGEIVSGLRPGGSEGRELTLYKSVGNAAQDLVTAQRVLDAAEEEGLGVRVAL